MYQAEVSGELLRDRRQLLASRISWISVGQTVILLGLTSLLADISSEMVSTTLPLYLFATLRFSPFQVGVADGVYQGAAVLVKVIGGMAADRWKRPKEVAAAGYGFSAFCRFGFLIAGASWTGISAAILLDRIGKGIRTAPRDAMIAASSPPGRVATAFGVHRALDTAGAMIGPLLAAAILIVSPQGYDAVFVVSFCVALIGLAVIVLLVDPAPADPHDNQTAVSLRNMSGLLAIKKFRTLILVGGALAIFTVSDSLLYLGLQQRIGLRTGLFPFLYVATALTFMILAIPAGRLADRLGPRPVFVLGYALLAGAYCALLSPLLSSRMKAPVALLIVVLLGSYYAATDGVLMAMASGMLPGHLRATGLALLTTGTGLGRLLASTLYGTVWSWYGAERALMFFAGGLIVALFLAWRTIGHPQGG